MTPSEFISALSGPALQCSRETGIPPSFLLAQCALETGWGHHAPHNNFFGIKATPDWIAAGGAVYETTTLEYEGGKPKRVVAKFRSYPDLYGSLRDHSQFLKKNPRYAPAFEHTDNGLAFALAVAKAGYATDPEYGRKLASIIGRWNLLQFDTAAKIAPEGTPAPVEDHSVPMSDAQFKADYEPAPAVEKPSIFALLTTFFGAFKAGRSLASSATWANGTALTTALVALLGGALTALRYFGLDHGVSDEQVQAFAAAVSALVLAGSSVVHVVTNPHAGVAREERGVPPAPGNA